MIQMVIGVQTPISAKIESYLYPEYPHPVPGDYVIIPSGEHEIELAKVHTVRPASTDIDYELPLVIRSADERDVEQAEANAQEAREAMTTIRELIARHELEMTPVDAHYTFMKEKMLVNFTADGRIDFRQLVRDLASTFQTRIELRQIGVRDEACKVGGYGICGSFLCCSRFLQEFSPVSIRMAKEQDLSLNPAKISGCCGRLLCCLTYENDHYAERNAWIQSIRKAEKDAMAAGIAEACRYEEAAENNRMAALQKAMQKAEAEEEKAEQQAEPQAKNRPRQQRRKKTAGQRKHKSRPKHNKPRRKAQHGNKG